MHLSMLYNFTGLQNKNRNNELVNKGFQKVKEIICDK